LLWEPEELWWRRWWGIDNFLKESRWVCFSKSMNDWPHEPSKHALVRGSKKLGLNRQRVLFFESRREPYTICKYILKKLLGLEKGASIVHKV
jgi:hypothetical protein